MNFQDWRRRLNEKALDTFGLIDIVSDENTKDDNLASLVERVSETCRLFSAKKEALSQHSAAFRAFHDSCRTLASDDLSCALAGATGRSSSVPTLLRGSSAAGDVASPRSTDSGGGGGGGEELYPLCPALLGFSSPNVNKAVEHVLTEHCIQLCNQGIEICDIMQQKSKRRHNMILDYSHHKRLFERIEAASDPPRTEDEEYIRRREKLVVATATLKEATSELTEVLVNFFGLLPAVRQHMSDGIVACHKLLANRLLSSLDGGSASSAAAAKIHAEADAMLRNVEEGRRTFALFKTEFGLLKKCVLFMLERGDVKYASEVYPRGGVVLDDTDGVRVKGTSERFGGGMGRGMFDRELSDFVDLAPEILTMSVKYLDDNGINFVGLFRVAGDQNEIEALEEAFYADVDFSNGGSYGSIYSPTNANVSVPNVSSLLKLWLRNLPTSLIPEKSYSALIKAATNPETYLKVLQEEMARWNNVHILCLKILVAFLVNVSSNSAVNKMTPDNLAIVFSPTILRPPADLDPTQSLQNVQPSIAVVQQIIVNASTVFPDLADAYKLCEIPNRSQPSRENKLNYGTSSVGSSTAPAVPSSSSSSPLRGIPPPIPAAASARAVSPLRRTTSPMILSGPSSGGSSSAQQPPPPPPPTSIASVAAASAASASSSSPQTASPKKRPPPPPVPKRPTETGSEVRQQAPPVVPAGSGLPKPAIGGGN